MTATAAAGVAVDYLGAVAVAVTDNDRPPVTVSFDSATYSPAEGDSFAVTVILSGDAERTVVVPLTRTEPGGATGDSIRSGWLDMASDDCAWDPPGVRWLPHPGSVESPASLISSIHRAREGGGGGPADDVLGSDVLGSDDRTAETGACSAIHAGEAETRIHHGLSCCQLDGAVVAASERFSTVHPSVRAGSLPERQPHNCSRPDGRIK